MAVRGCSPDSAARKAQMMTNFTGTPLISMRNALEHTYQGYVSNYTKSTEICHQPDLQSLHGCLIEPMSVSSTKHLFPLFGGSKLAVNNEILLPAPMYWENEERFTGGDGHGPAWQTKENKVIWRGVATGGKNKATNWKSFHRHRFVAMVNATKVKQVEMGQQDPTNWAMSPPQYRIKAAEAGELAKWVGSWSDAAFTDLSCDDPLEDGQCPYTSPHFDVLPGITMAEQFRCKFLPDIDGNSFSGRYLGFLRSSSLPIKATLFREWHDSRLVPWRHFVPMDNRFLDFFGIIEYFLEHDSDAEKIASEGQKWANTVLRPEDMQVYVLRLLLEYARVSDDERDMLGYVADLD
jgi:hypothetical protein